MLLVTFLSPVKWILWEEENPSCVTGRTSGEEMVTRQITHFPSPISSQFSKVYTMGLPVIAYFSPHAPPLFPFPFLSPLGREEDLCSEQRFGQAREKEIEGRERENLTDGVTTQDCTR